MLEQELEGKYVEDIAQTVQQREALAAEAARKQAAEEFKTQREKLSLSYLQKTHPDAMERLGHFIETVGEDAFLKLRETALETDDPAAWLYAKAKAVPLPGEIEEQVKQQVAAQMAAVLGKKQTDSATEAPPLAHFTAGSTAPDAEPDFEAMSDAELKAYKTKMEGLYTR